MILEPDNPTSPLFLVLLAAILIDTIYAWLGLVRGQIPNMRTTPLGARIAGVCAVISMVFVFVSYYFFSEEIELYGTVALGFAFGLFVGGILLSERIRR